MTPEIPTPRTDALVRSKYDNGLDHWSNDNAISFIDFARSLELKLQEAENQRDEAMKRYNIAISVDEEAFMKVRAERDQLRKAVDIGKKAVSISRSLAASAVDTDIALQDFEDAYSTLLHVKVKEK